MSIAEQFQRLTNQLGDPPHSYTLAELNDLLTQASPADIESLSAPTIADSYLANYVAAMVEQAAYLKACPAPPSWTSSVPPLATPVFATDLPSLRTHLLLNSPVPFLRRNIFIDSSIGERV